MGFRTVNQGTGRLKIGAFNAREGDSGVIVGEDEASNAIEADVGCRG